MKNKEISYNCSTTRIVPEENSSILKLFTCDWCDCFLPWRFTLGPLLRMCTDDRQRDWDILMTIYQ